MTCRFQRSGAIELYFYDELAPPDRAFLQSHLRQCVECRGALDDLACIQSALAGTDWVDGPADGDWSRFMARLEAATTGVTAMGSGDVEPSATSPQRAKLPGMKLPAMKLAGVKLPGVVTYLTMAALLTIVTIAVLLAARQRDLRQDTSADAPATSSTAPLSATTAPAAAFPANAWLASDTSDNPALVSVSGQHFERSKLVLLGLATRDANRQATSGWAYERELAGTLLGDTRLYRQAAEARGLSTLAGVMQDLEVVLLQTAMTEEQSAESLGQLQRLIRRRDLLTKMNVVNAEGS